MFCNKYDVVFIVSDICSYVKLVIVIVIYIWIFEGIVKFNIIKFIFGNDVDYICNCVRFVNC